MALPGPGVSVLRVEGPAERQVGPGQSIELAVFAEPLAPVTFHSSDRGAFQNGRATITVQADPAGKAVATFTATPGTVADVHIAAASPLCSGKVLFWIEVVNEETQRNDFTLLAKGKKTQSSGFSPLEGEAR